MEVATTRQALHARLREWRLANDAVALVPTMGNLHDGHLALVEAARARAERVVVSIFINPTQFEPGSDYREYPRTLSLDKRKLRLAGVDLVFVPDVETMYPFGTGNATAVVVPGLGDMLCGEFRPGHFAGVTSVVCRLLALVGPDVAVFGQKDYQQQVIIHRMVEDLGLPVDIAVAPTVREADGLALSSRNQYLGEDERKIAPQLYQTLIAIADGLRAGRATGELEAEGMDRLVAAGFLPDYVAIRDAGTLAPPDRSTGDLVVLAAARLGRARLIDNVLVQAKKPADTQSR